MDNQPGKFIIGLTGNIATGKTVVRRMLEHLGAFTVDADALTHRVYAKGTPAHQQVLEAFGAWLLAKNGEIDRARLGALVFNDHAALAQLEAIVHPRVRHLINALLQNASQSVIVLEAIKLLEGDLRKLCNSVWTTTAPEELQLQRLIQQRGMSRERALERIHLQSPQGIKNAVANCVITNTGSYEALWQQVNTCWQDILPPPIPAKPQLVSDFRVLPARPEHFSAIAALITRLSHGARRLSPANVMEGFGEGAYMLLEHRRLVVGLVSWRVDNFITRVMDFWLDPSLDPQFALDLLLKAVEHASLALQSEVIMAFPSSELAARQDLWSQFGFEKCAPTQLGAGIWQEAALRALPTGGELFFKKISPPNGLFNG